MKKMRFISLIQKLIISVLLFLSVTLYANGWGWIFWREISSDELTSIGQNGFLIPRCQFTKKRQSFI